MVFDATAPVPIRPYFFLYMLLAKYPRSNGKSGNAYRALYRRWFFERRVVITVIPSALRWEDPYSKGLTIPLVKLFLVVVP